MSQAVRLPKDLRFDAKEVYIKKSVDGKTIVLMPKNNSLKEFFDSEIRCSEDFMNKREQDLPQVRKIF